MRLKMVPAARSVIRALLVVAGLAAVGVSAATLAPFGNQQVLALDDATGGEWLGGAMVMDGTILAASTRELDGSRAAVHVFERRRGIWSRTATLMPDPDGGPGDRFGRALDVDAGRIVVGAYTEQKGRGAVYVFEKVDGEWTRVARITADRRRRNDWFGLSVAVSGDRLAVGTRDFRRGAVHTFELRDGEWVFVEKLISPERKLDGGFGSRLAMERTTLLIGANGEAVGGITSGAAYVYDVVPARGAETWSFTQRLIDDEAIAFDRFGTGLAINGRYLAVGTNPGETTSRPGSVSVYRRKRTGWERQARLRGDNEVSNCRRCDDGDYFGSTIALHRRLLVIGAPWEDPDGHDEAGAVYVFKRTGKKWKRKKRLLASAANRTTHSDFLGWQVGIVKRRVAASAYNWGSLFNSEQGGFEGGVFIFE